MKLIVTAGGQGKKIWPLSRESKPKQFQAIVGDETLYGQTIRTLLSAFSAEDIFVSTKKRYYDLASAQSPEILKDNYIIEPDAARDRGPGEGLAFLTLAMKHPSEPFMIIQPDCLRDSEEMFIKTIIEADKIERRDKKFMSGGMKATYPILGVDYLRLGKRIFSNDIKVYETDEFIPRSDDFNQTKDLIQNFYVAVHCNHNCWYPDLMLNAYQKYRPDWHESLMKIKDLIGKKGSEKDIDTIYEGMESGPTELVTTHLFKDNYTILLPYKWTDIGTWDSVYEFFDPDNQVQSDGQIVTLDSTNSLVKEVNPKKIIVANGINNLVIIDTEDALLICDKTRTQDVKKIVDLLKDKGLNRYI